MNVLALAAEHADGSDHELRVLESDRAVTNGPSASLAYRELSPSPSPSWTESPPRQVASRPTTA